MPQEQTTGLELSSRYFGEDLVRILSHLADGPVIIKNTMYEYDWKQVKTPHETLRGKGYTDRAVTLNIIDLAFLELAHMRILSSKTEDDHLRRIYELNPGLGIRYSSNGDETSVTFYGKDRPVNPEFVSKAIMRCLYVFSISLD